MEWAGMLSATSSQNTSSKLRRTFDGIFCKPFPDKETLGAHSQWTLLTRDMNPNAVIYSGGAGEDISFELELIDRFGVKVHLFDPSPVGKNTVAKALKQSDGLEKYLLFRPLGLAANATSNFSVGGGDDGSAWFRTATQGNSASVRCTTIPDEMHANCHDHIDLLKMDIEGSEYEVLENCLKASVRIKQICVEFHDFYPDISKMTTVRTITKLKRAGFTLIHKHRHDHTFYRADYL
jgi:FkbM family methyltransferase